MSISSNNVDFFKGTAGLINIGSATDAASTSLSLLSLNQLFKEYNYTLNSADPNGDLKINLGETFQLQEHPNHVSAGDPPELTLVGSGTYSSLLGGTQNVIIGEDSEGNQYVVFPEGNAPGILSIVASTLRIYRRGYDIITNEMVCFTTGTMIETDQGERAIENLRVGDRVRTLDNGFREIRWIGGRRLPAAALQAFPNLRPIRIRAGSLGAGLPRTDLMVSPQHRVLTNSVIAERMFGAAEVLIAAKHLTDIEGVEVAEDIETVTYWHILFDQHEIVFSNGAPTESLFAGPYAMASLPAGSRAEILQLFPELADTPREDLVSARDLVRGREGRQFAGRSAKNGKAIFAPEPTAGA